MSRRLAWTLHLWPPGHATVHREFAQAGTGRLTDRALGRGAWLIQVQLELGGSWVLAQTESRETS